MATNGSAKERSLRLADKIGMNKILQTAEDFNVNKYLDSNLSMSLGAGLVTLQEITNAYAMIVNGGKKIEPIDYEKVGKEQSSK